MIDLHCHMLPGIDDGPKTMDYSLAMARYAVSHGIQRCVVTPHIQPGSYDNTLQTIQPAFQAFNERLLQEEIGLRVEMGAEVRVCAELPMLISQQKIPFVGFWEGKQVMLMEFPHEQLPLAADKLVKWLISRDILPMIAHPERNFEIARQADKVMPFLDLGCLLQITADSVTGLFGQLVQNSALSFIKRGLATVLASDAHNLEKRLPDMTRAVNQLIPLIGEEKTNDLVSRNPAKMLA